MARCPKCKAPVVEVAHMVTCVNGNCDWLMNAEAFKGGAVTP